MIAQFHTDIYEEYEQDDWTALASNILQESSLSLGETEILSIGRTCAKAFSFAISVGRDMGFMEHMLNSHHYQALLDQFASDYGRFTSDWSKKKISLTSSRATIENEIGSLDQERVQVHEKLLELPSKIREISNEIAMHRDLLSQKETEFNTLEKILKDKESAYVRTMYEKEEATLKAAFLQAKEQLEQSVQFLHTIRKNDIDDLKAYTTPPQAVCLLADALCIIFDCPAGWQNAKRLLISNTFMSKILAVDREALPIYKIERLKRYSEMPNFHTDKMLNISVAARALCQWVKTLTNFAWIAGQMSSSEQIASRVRKVGIAKLSKTEEKFRYDQLALEKDTLSRAIRKLAALQRQEIGRLSILKEIIKPDSIFDRVNDEGYNESISQWIQQAFQCLDTGVTFDSLEVSQAHTTYLEAVKYLETVQLSLANESKRCEEIMREVKESLYSLTKDQIQEMVREKAQNPYSEQGMNIILFILGLHSQSLVEDIHLKVFLISNLKI